MKRRITQSISGTLTAMTLLVAGTALILAYVSFVAFDIYNLRNNLVQSLNTQAGIVGENTVSALLFDDAKAAESTLSALRRAPNILAAAVYRSDGTVFARYIGPGTSNQTIEPRLDSSQRSGYWRQSGTILSGRKILSDNKVLGAVYILADTGEINQLALQFGLISAAILMLCFMLAVLVTSRVRHLITRPLSSLADAARTVSLARDYSVRAEVPQRNDELNLVARSFNEMLDEIQSNRAALERKVADRTSQLLAANRELEAFSYSVAHDLRGPLQQVTNFAYLLESSLGVRSDSENKELLTQLMSCSVRMARLIDDLLNLSRATSTQLHYVPVDLSRMVASILANLANESNGRMVNTSIAPGVVIIADEGLLSLVMENLLRNAWKYSSSRDVAEIEFGVRETAEGCVYFVRDNGVGFDPTYVDRLFRPFQRLHSQADFPGTGVGLATVHRIISRHGGRVWAHSGVDKGAEFSFTLPYQPISADPDTTSRISEMSSVDY